MATERSGMTTPEERRGDSSSKTGIEVARDLREFIVRFARNPLLRVIDMKFGRAATKAHVERVRRAGGTPEELLEFYSVMNGVSFSWAFKDASEAAGEILIPTLGRNVKGWDGYFSFEEDEEGCMGSWVRLVDLAPMHQVCRLRPLYCGGSNLGVWNTWGGTLDLKGHTLRGYLSAAMENLFVLNWYDSYAAGKGPSAEAIEARARLGITGSA
jgi:hypothetical protein